jgi:nitrate reductase gamma subunit
VTLGLATIPLSAADTTARDLVNFMNWAQGIVFLNPHAAAFVAEVPLLFKVHLVLGMTLFLVFPFTRLVHIWSVPVWYLGRPGYQIMRRRRQQGAAGD